MRFLGIGNSNDLAAMYYGLVQRGHEVRVFVRDPQYHCVYKGLLEFSDNWERELGWVRAAGYDGFIVFESASDGETQDALRNEGFQVIGGSAFGDRLEADREFGQSALRAAGMRTARSHTFRDYAAAQAFVRSHPARYVLKEGGPDAVRTRSFVGRLPDGEDVAALLDHYQAQHAHQIAAKGTVYNGHVVLMEHLEGIEIGVGAYFNGESFLSPACIDFEHKHFFSGDLGELTGEMGTIVSYRMSERLFKTVLAPISDQLREGGYCGYINVNLIANAQGLWPLEFTSRFGYPGFSICEALHLDPWEAIFAAMAWKNRLVFDTHPGFAAGIVLTVPPFPYPYGYAQLSKGLPIVLSAGLSDSDRAAIHFAEVERHQEQLMTSGVTGYLGVVTGTGATPSLANARALRRAQGVSVPNLRYRNDIGERLERGGEWKTLQALGWLE